MGFKRYILLYSILFMNTLLCSYKVPNPLNIKRRLEESDPGTSMTKRYSMDSTKLTKYPSKILSKEEIDKSSVDLTSREYISSGKDEPNKYTIKKQKTKSTRNKRNLTPNTSRPYNNMPNNLKNTKASFLNGQSKILTGNPILITDNESTIPEFDGKYWENLLVTTGPKKIRNHYKSIMQRQLDDTSVYSYSNSMFLNMFLKFPSPIFTADSIRVRFGSGFLNFLSTDQLIRVLATLLSRDLRHTKAERTELVETIFGHIDFSLEMNFNNDQIVSIVTTLLRSDVPHCFEQVFLTWKMWKVFTTEEQEKMLEVVDFNTETVYEIGLKYEKKTLVMLYLFVLNRDTDNSSMCEAFKENVIKVYGEGLISNYTFTKNDYKSRPFEYIKMNLSFSDIFDVSLLELPTVLKFSSDTVLISFKKFVKGSIHPKGQYLSSSYFGKRYKIHICYALTKFTREIAHDNDKGDISIYDKLYFEPDYIKYIFLKWSSSPKKDSNLATRQEINEFRNAYGALRQIVKSEEYDSKAFLRLFQMMNIRKSSNRLFATFLFSLTRDDILRKVSKTPKWIEHVKNRNWRTHKFIYIENIFMYNTDPYPKQMKISPPSAYIERITGSLSKLICVNKNLHRECYLYKQLLFHTKFKIFNGPMMPSYISSLDKAGQLNNKENRVQFARNLIFNEYYHSSAVSLIPLSLGAKENVKEFKISLEEEYKRYENKNRLENERETLKNC